VNKILIFKENAICKNKCVIKDVGRTEETLIVSWAYEEFINYHPE